MSTFWECPHCGSDIKMFDFVTGSAILAPCGHRIGPAVSTPPLAEAVLPMEEAQ